MERPSWLRTVRTMAGCLALAGLAAPSAAADSPWLVTGGLVVTMDADYSVYHPGAVLVEDGRIAAVGSARELERRHPKAVRVDASGMVVLPGLVNAHTHVPMTIFRGLADDLPLMEWLEDHVFPAEARWVDEEFVRWGTRLACLELLRGGVTTFADMYYFEDAIAEEVDTCGLRAVLGETLIDFPAPDHATWDEAVAYTDAFLERWRDHERVIPAVAPHAPYTVSSEHLIAAHELARRHDVPLLIHLAEDRAEIATIRERHGRGSVEYLAGLGMLTDRVVAAHVVWPTDGEIGLLAAAGVGVSHCPESNMKVAAGIAPVPRMLERGVAVGLGTDGPASNNDLDLWDEMDTAAKLHKVAALDPTVLDARTVLTMATLGGAQALDLEAIIGSLESGKRADLILVATDGFHQTPHFDPYSLLVYSTKAADVVATMVEGRWLMRDGVVESVDEAAVRARVERYRQGLARGPREGPEPDAVP